MRQIHLHLSLLVSLTATASSQSCFKIHGRAVDYRGDGFFAIWHVGTRHEFFPADSKSADLICNYFDCESGDRQPALFADFTVCPTEPHTPGAAQPATVTAVERPHVIPDWPPPNSPKKFLEGFLAWYVPRGRNREAGGKWEHVLELMQWDLSPQLQTLLGVDSAGRAGCKLGFDFDPVLGAAIPGDHYEVGSIHRSGDRYRAEIFEVHPEGRKKTPNVIAEFFQRNQAWTFADFEYPVRKTDLLSLLKASQKHCY